MFGHGVAKRAEGEGVKILPLWRSYLVTFRQILQKFYFIYPICTFRVLFKCFKVMNYCFK